jgi:tRNA-dependent cyclodipeptide synthase
MNNIFMDPVNERSSEIWHLGEHVLLTVATFSGEEGLDQFFAWGLHSFKKMNVFMMDKVSAFTLQAFGYSKEEYEKNIKTHDIAARERVMRALIKNKLSKSEAESKLVFLSELSKNNKEYIKIFNACKDLYKNDKLFREGCLEFARWILMAEVNPNTNEETLGLACQYYVSMFPLYIDTPAILNVSSSTFAYSEFPSKFLKSIYDDKSPFSSLLSPKQAYLTARF